MCPARKSLFIGAVLLWPVLMRGHGLDEQRHGQCLDEQYRFARLADVTQKLRQGCDSTDTSVIFPLMQPKQTTTLERT
jgi:hypothetical protein